MNILIIFVCVIYSTAAARRQAGSTAAPAAAPVYKQHLLARNYRLLPRAYVRRHAPPARDTRRDIKYEQLFRPDKTMVKNKCIDLMRQAIYASQGNLKLLDGVSAMTSDDIAYRMAFIFSTMDKLKADAMSIYTVAYNNMDTSLDRLLYYLEHVARKNVDMTYITEYVIRFYNDLNKFASNLNAELMKENANKG